MNSPDYGIDASGIAFSCTCRCNGYALAAFLGSAVPPQGTAENGAELARSAGTARQRR
jgi:hypothetical protein